MHERLFETWDGEDSTLESDLSWVFKKHGLMIEGLSAEELAQFTSDTLGALRSSSGNTSSFLTEMFMIVRKALTRGRSNRRK